MLIIRFQLLNMFTHSPFAPWLLLVYTKTIFFAYSAQACSDNNTCTWSRVRYNLSKYRTRSWWQRNISSCTTLKGPWTRDGTRVKMIFVPASFSTRISLFPRDRSISILSLTTSYELSGQWENLYIYIWI